MKDKSAEVLEMVISLANQHPIILGLLALLYLLSLRRRPVGVLKTTFLLALFTFVFIWFWSMFENRNTVDKWKKDQGNMQEAIKKQINAN